MRKLLLSAAALSMVAGTTVAQAAPVEAPRAGTEMADAEGLGGFSLFPLLLGLAGLIFAIVVIADDDTEDDSPISV